ncbi:MAG TPA: hypothetical protein VFA12_01930 [Stellaceae bacterium]|nr:hypothetical protein [Stellaceae bacterium]
MTGTRKGTWFRRIGLAAVAALTLGAVTVPTKPADARVFIGVGVPAWGYAPYYGYPYYGYYGYPYYPAYYGYPGGVYFGFGGGWGGWHHGWHHGGWHGHWR